MMQSSESFLELSGESAIRESVGVENFIDIPLRSGR